jgi:hypothetical protein
VTAPRLPKTTHESLIAIVKGAVMNTMGAHPEFDTPWKIRTFANSVAKRAVGMIKRELEQSSAKSGGPAKG